MWDVEKCFIDSHQMNYCFLSHFPSLREITSNRFIDNFHEAKECFNINITGQGFDTAEATKKNLLQSSVISLPPGIHHFESQDT